MSTKHLVPSTTFIRGLGRGGELHGPHRSRGSGRAEQAEHQGGEETHSKLRRARFAVSLEGPGDLHRHEKDESDRAGSEMQQCMTCGRRSPPGRQDLAQHLVIADHGVQAGQVLIGPAHAGVSWRAFEQREDTCDSPMGAPGVGGGLGCGLKGSGA